jgi:hypothetical protein
MQDLTVRFTNASLAIPAKEAILGLALQLWLYHQ